MSYKERISELKKELEELEKKELAYKELPDAYKLADAIHSHTCRFNHIDQCGYEYQSWDTERGIAARSSYVQKANQMLRVTTLEVALKIISCL